jgi:hypothetical protein
VPVVAGIVLIRRGWRWTVDMASLANKWTVAYMGRFAPQKRDRSAE